MNEEMQKLIAVLGKGLKHDVELKDYTTLKIGGQAKYFYEATKVEDLIKALLVAKKTGIKYFLLGNGSNILISDSGFDGLVILNRTNNISFLFDKAQVIVDSGVMLSRLIMQAAQQNLGGLEPLFGIPTTVGGAVYGNAGANKIEISQFIKAITVLNSEGKIVRVYKEWLKPTYRSTVLKQLRGQGKEVPVILTVTLQLMPRKKEEIVKKIQYYQRLRIKKQPYDKLTCGSVFKNPGDGVEQSAGYIIDQQGLKGRKVGEVEVSRKHANFIENRKEATASEVKELIDQVKQEVADKQGIELQEEIEYVGF